MRIKRIEVTNFRALRNSALDFAETTALLGENNCGKSAFLLALDLFCSGSPKISAKDFSDDSIDKPIDITIHFSDLTPEERREFDSHLLDSRLVVTRRFMLNNMSESGKFFISARVNPGFAKCRNESGKTEKRKLYADIREALGNPPELKKEKSADEIEQYLVDWEANHPDDLRVEKVASFKGWTNVAAGKLKQKTTYILIRAVQDAAEELQQSKSSPVKNLIDAIARQTIENSADFKAFMDGANEEISRLTNPENVPVLADISGGLTSILSSYYKDSEIVATWSPVTQIAPSFPECPHRC